MDTTRTPSRQHDSAATDPATDTGPRLVPPFEGYPYLVTRIGFTALRHIAIVPADWTRERLIDVTRRQAEANQLNTCLCLGPGDAVYVVPGREPESATHIPTGLPVIDRLVIAGPIPETDEQERRRSALRAYAVEWPGDGYIVGDGLEGGRLATIEDISRLSGSGSNGLPPGLSACHACGRARGEYLAVRGEGNGDLRPRVVDVHCACDNHNRCAGCGEPLAGARLSAYAWHGGSVRYFAAYMGLSHRCQDPERRAAQPD